MVIHDEKSELVQADDGRMISLAQVKPGDPCFFCLEPLSYPFIFWGGSCAIGFHPGCVVNFASRIIPDVQEVKKKYVSRRQELLTVEL